MLSLVDLISESEKWSDSLPKVMKFIEVVDDCWNERPGMMNPEVRDGLVAKKVKNSPAEEAISSMAEDCLGKDLPKCRLCDQPWEIMRAVTRIGPANFSDKAKITDLCSRIQAKVRSEPGA